MIRYDRCGRCRRVHDKGAEHDCNMDQPLMVGDGFAVTMSREYSKPEERMRCFVCMVDLEREWPDTPGLPGFALCLSGDGHYGSLHDQEAMCLGFRDFEIYVCDKCWDARRSLAVGRGTAS